MISEYLNLNKKAGTFGLEIETETKSVDNYPESFFRAKPGHNGHVFLLSGMDLWEGHKDGSLRNFGMEFVLKDPMSIDGVRIALDEFETVLKDVKFIKDAMATSVHVHVNVGDFTLVELGNLVTTWMLFENVVVDFCGEARATNLFALPTRCAESTMTNLVNLFSQAQKGHKGGMMIHDNHAKYGAMNICSLCKFGSIEFRSMRGTTDKTEILAWVEILDEVYRYARTSGLTPRGIMDTYREIGPDMLKVVFQKSYMLLSSGIDVASFIERNAWYAGMVSDSADWDTIDNDFKSGSKKKKVKVSGSPFGTIYINESQPLSLAQVQAQAMANSAPPPAYLTTDEVALFEGDDYD